jgi:hypothetical protein
MSKLPRQHQHRGYLCRGLRCCDCGSADVRNRRFDPAGVAAQTALVLLQIFPNLETLYADLARLATLPLGM